MIILMNAALIPPLLLLIYVYHLDSVEHEPPGLIAALIVGGALSVISAYIIETIGMYLVGVLIPQKYTTLIALIENFIIVAWAEEGGKHFVMKRITWNHRAFDYTFDGVVYGVSASLGFAAAENISYLMRYGLGVAPVRAFTAIPLHCICGIFMGHFYGLAKSYKERGFFFINRLDMFLSMLVPVLIHGTYDFAASIGNWAAAVFFVIFVIALVIFAFFRIRSYASSDKRID